MLFMRVPGLRAVVVVVGAVGLLLAPAPSRAQSPTQPTAPQGPPPAVAEQRAEEPSLQERRIVAFVASGVAVASLAGGITMGVLAQQQYACAEDIIACNQTLQNKVVGEELQTLRAEIEQKALFADMFYLFSAAAALVATVGFLRGYVFVEDDPAPVALGPVLPAPVFVAAEPPASAPLATCAPEEPAVVAVAVAVDADAVVVAAAAAAEVSR
jgi:hypothetical protein